MNKRILLVFLCTIILIPTTCLAFTIDGDSVFIEDAQASLRVTPHTARFPVEGYQQEFEVCNKTGVATQLFAAYLFDYSLTSGKAEYLSSENYEWVERRFYCNMDFDYNLNVNPSPNVHQGECYRIDSEGEKQIELNTAFKSGNPETGEIVYDVNTLVKNWGTVTNKFEYKIIQNKQAYAFTDGKVIEANTCETWRVTYTPNEFDSTEKWDLWLWAGANWACILDNSCDKVLKLDPWWSGTGSSGDPFIITDCNQLENMDAYVNQPGVYFELGNDIDCIAHGNFEPVGKSKDATLLFEGHLDGKNYSISNLIVNTAEAHDAALIGAAGDGATFENLALIDFNIYNEAAGAAALVTYSGASYQSRGYTVSNVYVHGGLFVSSPDYGYAGGLIGMMEGDHNISDSYSYDANVYVPTAANCDGAGGLVGSVKGFTGGYDVNIFHSYSTANVASLAGNEGGLVGLDVGGDPVCPESFWDTETSEQAADACTGTTGKTTANMWKQATFTNWDFDTVWDIEEDVNYPTLESFAEAILPVTVHDAIRDVNSFWQNNDINLNFSCSISSGTCAIFNFSINDVNQPQKDWGVDNNVGIPLSTTDVNYVIAYWTTSGADVNEDIRLVHIAIDKTPPTLDHNAFDADTNYFTADVNVNVHCKDAQSGAMYLYVGIVGDTNYQYRLGDDLNIGIPVTVDGNTLMFIFCDNNSFGVGDKNSASVYLNIGLDSTAPTVVTVLPAAATTTYDPSPAFVIEISEAGTVWYGFYYNGVLDYNGVGDVNADNLLGVDFLYLISAGDTVSLVVNKTKDVLDNNSLALASASGEYSFLILATQVTVNLTNFGNIILNISQLIERITGGIELQGGLIGLAIGIFVAIMLFMVLLVSMLDILPKGINKLREMK